MSKCPVVQVVSEAHAQYGGFVEINESDFDPKVHTLFDPEAAKKALNTAELREALTAKGVAFPEAAKKAELQSLLEKSE